MATSPRSQPPTTAYRLSLQFVTITHLKKAPSKEREMAHKGTQLLTLPVPPAIRYLFGFIAGFVAVLVFHQGMLDLLHAMGFTAQAPFSRDPTKPFGVPVLWSLAFWGGIWGVIYSTLDRYFPKGVSYWFAALFFGAVGPTLVAALVVWPLKGQPHGTDVLVALTTELMTNGVWGVGTGFVFRWLLKRE